YSFDAAQDLRRSRHNAVGYQTAMFTGDMASFRPFLPFEDFDILDPVGWEDKIEDKIFTERVKQITDRKSTRLNSSHVSISYALYRDLLSVPHDALPISYSFDAAQDLRRSRHNAVGYQTAMFTGDMASFRPFLPFEDFDILDPVGWEDKIEDKIFTERVKQI